jgi:hypothetical protein
MNADDRLLPDDDSLQARHIIVLVATYALSLALGVATAPSIDNCTFGLITIFTFPWLSYSWCRRPLWPPSW